jgi:hypothetical protein
METDYLKITFRSDKGIFLYKVGEVIGNKSKLIKKIEVDTNSRMVVLTLEHYEGTTRKTTYIRYPFENVICMETFEESGGR